MSSNMRSSFYVCVLIVMELSTGSPILCPKHCTCMSNDMECFQIIPDIIPQLITKVTIFEASLGNVFNFSGAGWCNITDLAINPGTSVFHNRPEASRTLHYKEFFALKNLERLQIACKYLKTIQRNAFLGLSNVKVLDLSNNIDLKIEMIVEGLLGKDILPNLTELYLRNVSVVNYHPVFLTASFFVAVKDKPLKILDISNTENALFDRTFDILQAFPHLEKLNLSRAGIAAPGVVEAFQYLGHSPVSSFMKLQIIDFSYPAVSSKMIDAMFGISIYRNLYFYLPPYITEIYVKKILTAPLSLKGTSNSTHTCFKQGKKSFKFCVINRLHNLKKLVASENSFKYLDPNLLQMCKSLQYLDLSKNDLGKSISEGNYTKSVLDVLHNLEVLVVSENHIFEIPEDSFRSSKSLKILDLSKNSLESVTFKTSNLLSLQKLDLSGNKIVYLDVLSQKRLINLQNILFQNSHPNTSTLLLNLHGNPFKCFCDSVTFLKWIEAQNESYDCLLSSNTAVINFFSIKESEYMCRENTVITVFSILLCIEALIIGLAVQQLLLEIRQREERKKIQKGINKYKMCNKNENRRKFPPVFLSFCGEDEDFVMEHIYVNLDDGMRKILQTESRCIATGGTDFQPGFPLANEIIRCIEASSVIVFFVTNAFCRKSWCKNEALVAHCNNKPTVLMLWEKVDVKLMPKHLYTHYQQYTRVHWVKEDGQLVMKPDWNKLCQAIVKLVGENLDKADI